MREESKPLLIALRTKTTLEGGPWRAKVSWNHTNQKRASSKSVIIILNCNNWKQDDEKVVPMFVSVKLRRRSPSRRFRFGFQRRFFTIAAARRLICAASVELRQRTVLGDRVKRRFPMRWSAATGRYFRLPCINPWLAAGSDLVLRHPTSGVSLHYRTDGCAAQAWTEFGEELHN